jgi:hypothetical protein
VADAHTYFVGDNKWLVHNACADKLWKALGIPGGIKGFSAHHLVSRNSKYAQGARDILAKAGIGLDDMFNGVPLPSSYHSKIHTKIYYAAIERRLQVAYDVGGTKAVERMLQKIATQISMGTFPY